MGTRTTEADSKYRDLEKKSTLEIITDINNEDKTVPYAIEKAIPQIEILADAIYHKMKDGGRLFYIGAGTSGRLGIVDASECPPTFGVPHDWVIGLMAGGDSAMRKAVEFAEDDINLAWKDLSEHTITDIDFVVGVAASGTTPYVINGLLDCNKRSINTGCISCNLGSPLGKVAKYPVEVVVGPEYVTGSTRMKSGTAQKLVLNMLSTTIMIKLGRVKDNKMVDMQLTNNKLVDRGIKMVMDNSEVDYETANKLLILHGSVRAALASLEF
ncbi:MAG: N-acetylmuramic acid 6-phosphate etherase [Saprospiraceae bacterium]|jgi:N-acetylmuramic acid 6-phosphate etherase